jgi:hypothetical protein
MNSKLIEKFFRKECTPEEVRQVLAWFSRDEVQPWQEDDLRSFWEAAEIEKRDPRFAHDPKEILELIHQEMDKKQKVSSDKNCKRKTISFSNHGPMP